MLKTGTVGSSKLADAVPPPLGLICACCECSRLPKMIYQLAKYEYPSHEDKCRARQKINANANQACSEISEC